MAEALRSWGNDRPYEKDDIISCENFILGKMDISSDDLDQMSSGIQAKGEDATFDKNVKELASVVGLHLAEVATIKTAEIAARKAAEQTAKKATEQAAKAVAQQIAQRLLSAMSSTASSSSSSSARSALLTSSNGDPLRRFSFKSDPSFNPLVLC